MKQFYKVLILLMGLAAAPAVYAQTAFTLQQCIQYALENSVQVQNARLDEAIAQARVHETIGIGLPQISGSAMVMHNNKLPRFFNTYNGPGGFFDFSSIPGIQVGDVVAAENFFQLKSSGDMNVSVNQLIFSGSYIVGLKASKTYKELSYKATDQSKEQIVQQVTKAYYTVLINKERITLFSSNIARVDSLLKNTKALYENGFAESIDADRIQVTLNNLIVERDKFLNMNELGLALLKFQMNYPMNQQLDVAGSIKDVNVDAGAEPQVLEYANRPDYQLLEVNKRLQELNIKNISSASLPTLSAFAKYGYSTQSSSIGGLFKTESGFDELPGVGPDKWYDYSNFGINLSIPIFSGLQNRYKIQQEKIALEKINNNFRSLKAGIDLEVQQAGLNYDNALKSLKAQQQNMDLAAKVANVTKIKYEQGVGSNLEVIDAEDALRQAQTNYYNALFDALVAKVDLDKAYGKLLPTNQNK
ncbi:MAG: TolC family protein [Bacteroidetes bacterium CHB5]|nr:TolC family protein [Bacteroidetes bacterium CHB5]